MSTTTILPLNRTREKLLTVADLAKMPRSLPSGDVCYELKDGNLIIMAPPGDSHGRRQAKIIHFLVMFGENQGHGEARGEVGIVLRREPDRVVGADAAFVLSKSLPVRKSPEGYLETIPELVVEVRSKNDFRPEIASKIEEYFDAGVELIWVIDSDARIVTAHRRGMPDQTFQQTETLTCYLIPGFALPIASLFAGS
jgi:Uma2 family endonuclease